MGIRKARSDEGMGCDIPGWFGYDLAVWFAVFYCVLVEGKSFCICSNSSFAAVVLPDTMSAACLMPNSASSLPMVASSVELPPISSDILSGVDMGSLPSMIAAVYQRATLPISPRSMLAVFAPRALNARRIEE